MEVINNKKFKASTIISIIISVYCTFTGVMLLLNAIFQTNSFLQAYDVIMSIFTNNEEIPVEQIKLIGTTVYVSLFIGYLINIILSAILLFFSIKSYKDLRLTPKNFQEKKKFHIAYAVFILVVGFVVDNGNYDIGLEGVLLLIAFILALVGMKDNQKILINSYKKDLNANNGR